MADLDTIQEMNFQTRMAILDEMRMLAAERRLREQQNVAEKTNTKRDGKSSPVQRELICLHQLAQDEQ